LLSASEALEDPFSILRGDAVAMILDSYIDEVLVAPDRNRHDTAAVRVCIVEEIDDGARYLLPVDEHRRIVAGSAVDQEFGRASGRLKSMPNEAADADPRQLSFLDARVEPPKRDEIFEGAAESVELGRHQTDGLG
jgi:hypothetical protein